MVSSEHTVIPTLKEFVLITSLGISGAGIAYQLWDYGAKHGNLILLSLLNYVTPVVSMSLLVCFGKESSSLALWVACAMVSFGVVLGTANINVFFRFFRRLVQGASLDQHAHYSD